MKPAINQKNAASHHITAKSNYSSYIKMDLGYVVKGEIQYDKSNINQRIMSTIWKLKINFKWNNLGQKSDNILNISLVSNNRCMKWYM